MVTETTQQIIREDPAIEAYKLDLLKQAKSLAFNEGRTPLAEQLPGYTVEGFSAPQTTAINAATAQGIGAFDPYLTSANQAVAQAYQTTGEAANVLRGADTRDQFFNARQAMGQAGQATGNITSGIGQVGQGLGYLDAAAQRAAMSDTTGQFGTARGDISRGAGALATGQNMASLYSQANLQPATSAISQGLGGLSQAQQLALGTQPNFNYAGQMIQQGVGQGQQAVGMASQAAQQGGFGQGINTAYEAAQQARLAAAQPGFNQAQGTIQQGIGQLGGATQGYNPASAQAFMDPYRQQVIDESLRQIDRQGSIAQQGLSSQAVRAGAFGGTREGVQRAELQRGLLEQKANTIANLMSQGYSQAQAQGMQAFEQQQQRQMQAGQGIGQLGGQQASIAAQQAGLGQSAAQQLAQAAQLQTQTAGQQGQLGQQAAQLAAQQGQLGLQAGSQLGSLEAQRAQLGQAAAGLYGNLAQNQVAAGQSLGQLGLQQAQLGQGAAGQYLQASQQYGNLAGQGAALAGQESSINQNIANLMMQQSQARNQAAQTAAGIYGQQAQQFQGLGQGIGALAGQEFGQGAQMSSGLGQLGAQQGQLGIQQGALGQTAQSMRQGDINFLYNVGQSEQALNQQKLDAKRATELQKVYSPYQQAAFLSDIYKGAPSSQMQTTAASVPSASPFQQALGVGLGAISTAAGAKKAGLF